MALIAQETIAQVKQAVDIVETVGAYFPLKRAGANHKALCPFHEEKSASFNVNPERQIFHCFGCGKGGDTIDFVMEFEKVDYPEAIRILADRNGITVKYTGAGPQGAGRREIYYANEWAAGVFRSLLLKAPEAEVARQFLVRRGVTEESAEIFRIGFSLDSWDHLIGRGRRGDMSDKLLAAAGLAVEKAQLKGHFYDRFRGRLMFPIHDARGAPIAFGARTLKEKDEDGPKFINSPETAIFSKGRGLYGLHLAKEEWERTRTAYIVEGYLDVVVPYQEGVRGLVATLGTSLTRDHLKILRRFVDKVVLVFDADAAGQKAAERGLDLLLSENMDLFVAELPAGMDPDDVVLKLGPEKLRERLDKPREIFDFLIASLTAKHDSGTPAARARIVQEMLERVAQVPDPVKREILVQELSRRFGVEDRTLHKGLLKVDRPAPAPPPQPPAPLSAEETAARDLLACAAADQGAAGDIWITVAVERYPTEALRRVAEAAYALYDRTERVDARDLVDSLRDSGLAGTVSEILCREVSPASLEGLMASSLEVLTRPQGRSAALHSRPEADLRTSISASP